ncbi:DM13 domain-containing protein [Nitrospinae bacterium AH_259_B05_G02_I21]|nr:DM13 domain-containing protein [Nitrospinae bacterium AH_259_B05_G02_I21]
MHGTSLDWFRQMVVLVIALVAMPVAAQAASEIVASGTFEGRGGHIASGGVTVLKTGDGYVVRLEPDFRFNGAPDPKLGFGKDGYESSTKFSALRSNSGMQTYRLRGSIDPTTYDELWLWCEQFDVPLGVAHLKAP